ncbi:MAG: dihydrofolate reductase family protein [Anaerolineales bacterium]|nr:dihydrofolate reductase family protein [Anaerolineales bacterium]
MIEQLWPRPGGERPLAGTYLAHELRRRGRGGERPFVYANFVSSLDGRIAVPHLSGVGLTVPKAIANARDWRLFQELAAQADLIISTGRYLRDWADGRAQEILQVDDPRFADLRAWRAAQGLKPQPDIAIVSASLLFPIPDVLTANGRRVVVFTGADPDPARVAEIEARAGRVIVAGGARVEGAALARAMGALGYRVVYSAAGPRILHMLVAGGVLDRLYLTLAGRLLGGDPCAGSVDGGRLETAVNMRRGRRYWEGGGLDGVGQLFAVYDRG